MAEKYIRKGTQLYIEGRLRTRSWTDQTGNKRYTTEVTVDNLQLLGKKSDNPGAHDGGQGYAQGGYQSQGQQGYGQPAVRQTQGPVQQPVQQPMQQPVQQPMQQPVQQPMQQAPVNPIEVAAADMPQDDLPF